MKQWFERHRVFALAVDEWLGGWARYRRWRGGEWDEQHCPDGIWYRVDLRNVPRW